MTSTNMVRLARKEDQQIFLDMWDEFVSTDPDEPGDRNMGRVNWDRLNDPEGALRGLMAVNAQDCPVGFLLYLSFPFTWSNANVCYLQDIFVRPQERGRGLAAAMIRQLEAIGRQENWFKIFWMTQKHNVSAQRLYDRIGLKRDYIRYDLMI